MDTSSRTCCVKFGELALIDDDDLNPRPRNGEIRPVGVGDLDGFGDSSLMMVNDDFLCSRPDGG